MRTPEVVGCKAGYEGMREKVRGVNVYSRAATCAWSRPRRAYASTSCRA